jgi:hypothetical protein
MNELLAKALIRVEKKLDELLKLMMEVQKAQSKSPFPPFLTPLDNPSQGACPVCLKPIMYLEVQDPETNGTFPIRLCGCEPRAVKLPAEGES